MNSRGRVKGVEVADKTTAVVAVGNNRFGTNPPSARVITARESHPGSGRLARKINGCESLPHVNSFTHSCGLGRDVAGDLSRLLHFRDGHPRNQTRNVGGDAEPSLHREASHLPGRRKSKRGAA